MNTNLINKLMIDDDCIKCEIDNLIRLIMNIRFKKDCNEYLTISQQHLASVYEVRIRDLTDKRLSIKNRISSGV